MLGDRHGGLPEASAKPTIAAIKALKADADFHAFHLVASLTSAGYPGMFHAMEYVRTSSDGVVEFRAKWGMERLEGAHYSIHYDPATYEVGIVYFPPPHQLNPVEVALLVVGPFAGKLVSTGISKLAGKVGAKRTSRFVNLASKARTKHILYSDATGGGHMFGLRRLRNGKTKFPVHWSKEKIMHAVSQVATDPKNIWIQKTGPRGALTARKGAPVRWLVEGTYKRTKIRVIVEGADIITGYPIK